MIFQKTPKITVEILGEAGIKTSKKFPIEGNTVVIRQPRKGPGGTAYKPTFDRTCLIPYSKGIWPFKRINFKLMLKDGAKECISFFKEPLDIPMWDRKTEEDLFKANVIKAAGATVQKLQVPTWLGILAFLTLVFSFVGMLFASGQLRFVG